MVKKTIKKTAIKKATTKKIASKKTAKKMPAVKQKRLPDFEPLNVFKDVAFQEARDKGWHSGWKTTDLPLEHKDSKMGNYTSNLHEEVSELWSAWRKEALYKQCDKAQSMMDYGIDPLTCAEEEIADIVIRALDAAAALEIDLARAVRSKMLYNRTRAYRHGNKAA